MAAVYGVARPQPQPDLATAEGLIEAIEKQTALLTTVSTGGPRIADVNDEYRRHRQALIPALRRHGLTYPFPRDDLWEWHGHWSTNLRRRTPLAERSSVSRRGHARCLAQPGAGSGPC